MPIKLSTQNITNMYTPIELVSTGNVYVAGGGITDHGQLHGLGDNDHPQYALTADLTAITLMGSHDHGSTANVTGQISGTIGSDAWSLSIPAFLITAAPVSHTHAYMGTNTSTVATVGSLLNVYAGTDGITMRIPNYITTAPTVTHMHGSFLGTGIALVSSGSGGLALSVQNGSLILNDANNISFGSVSAGVNTTITASAKQTFAGSNYLFSGFAGSSANVSGIPYGLSLTATPGGNNITLGGNTHTDGSAALISSGTATIAGGNNITLSQSGNAFTIIGAAAGTGGAGTGFTTIATNGSDITGVLDANGIRIGVPAFITTAPNLGIGGIGNTSTIPFTTGSIIFSAISNITVNTSVNGASQYIRLSVADPAAAQNAVSAGSWVSLSVDGVSTQVNITGLQATASTSAITSAAFPTANTTNLITGIIDGSASVLSRGALRFSNTNGISFGFNGSTLTAAGAFIGSEYQSYYYPAANSTTFALISHSHGNISFGSTTATSETSIRATSGSGGLTLVVPPYITAAGAHTHGSNVNTYTNSTINSIAFASNSTGLSMTYPQLAMSTHTHANLYSPLGFSTHIHGVPSISLSNFSSSSTASASSGFTIGLTGYPATSFVNVSDTGNVYFADSLGSNITWSSSVTGGSTYIGAIAGGGTGGTGGVAVSIGTGGNSTSAGSGFSNVSTGTALLIGGDNITLSQNGSRITIIGGASGAGGNISISAGVSSNATNRLYFSNGSGVSFGLSGGSIITASINPVGGAAGSAGSIASITGSGTAMLMTLNGTGLTLSYPNWATQYVGRLTTYVGGNTGTMANTAVGGTINSSQLSIVIPEGSIYYSDNTALSFSVSTSGLNSTINAYARLGSVYFNDSNGISWGSSSNGSSTTITVMNGPRLSNFVHPSGAIGMINENVSNGVLSIKYMPVYFNVTGTAFKIGASLSGETNTSATTASANLSFYYGIYTLNGSTLSLSTSGSANNAFQWSQSASTDSNTSVDGLRQITGSMNVNMTPGEYWAGIVISSATTYTGANINLLGGQIDQDDWMVHDYINPIGSTVQSMLIPFQGLYVSSTSGIPSSIVKASIDYTGDYRVYVANFYNAIYNNTY